MALDTGKKQIKIQRTIGEIPYVEAKSKFSIAVDSFAPTLDRMQNEHAATAQANYFQKFQIETRDYFLNLSNDEEIKNNPELMKAAVDTYSKELLQKVPPAYKIQANAMLSGASTNLVLNASNNRMSKDEANFEFLNNEIWKTNNTNAEFAISTAADIPEMNLAITGINDKTTKAILTLNEQSHSDYELLVKKGSKETRSDKVHMANITDSTKALHISNGFHMMRAIGDEAKALEWLNLFANNKNPNAITDKEIQDNPIFKIYQNQLKDDDTRNEIVDAILARWKDFKKDRFSKTGNSKKIHLDPYYEPNALMSWENFQGSDKSGHDVAMSIPNMEFGSEKYNKIVEDTNYRNSIQAKVSKFIQGGKLIDFESEQEKSDIASAILANFGIHDIQMGMVNGEFTESFITATNLLSELNVFPDEFKNYLKIDGAGSYEKPEVLMQLKEKILAYNYLTSSELFPNWGGADPFLKWAAEQGIESRNDIAAAETLNKYKDIDWDLRYNNIKESFNDGVDEDGLLWFDINRFNNSLGSATYSPNAFLKLFMDHKNPYHKHLLAQSDQTTWMSWRGERIVPAHAKMQLKELFINEMTLMSNSDDFDIWAKENGPLRKKAWHRTMQRLKDENWGIETHTSDGVPRLVKNPYWLNKGGFNNNDIYAAMNKDFHLLDKEGQMEKWGTNNWNEVVDMYFKQYADNPNGEVKIALDNDGTNNYKLTFHKGADAITLEENFHPHNWMSIDKDAPASATQVHNHVADLMYKEFQKTDLYKNLDKSKSQVVEKAIYGFARMSVGMGDWRWYPDIPGLDDMPMEIRPLAFIAKMAGFDGDLRELRTTFETMAAIKGESLSFVKKINMNRKINDTESAVEALFPPHKMPFTKNNMDLHFRTWVTENYKDESKALTHRTNNWGAVSSADWDGEMDIKYNRDSRKFAVFSHPKNSIRAAVKTIINHSSLTASLNKIDTRYGDNPSIEEILTMYAQDTSSYLRALDQHTSFEKTDKIDLMDSNQMHKLLKFIVKHEMGHEYYKENFGTSNAYVDNVIIQGYNEAIYSYNGELGKL